MKHFYISYFQISIIIDFPYISYFHISYEFISSLDYFYQRLSLGLQVYTLLVVHKWNWLSLSLSLYIYIYIYYRERGYYATLQKVAHLAPLILTTHLTRRWRRWRCNPDAMKTHFHHWPSICSSSFIYRHCRWM